MRLLPFKHPAYVGSVATLVVAALGFGAAIDRYKIFLKKDPVPPPRLFTAIPAETPAWKQVGSDRRETAEVEAVLGTTNYVSRTYVKKEAPGARVTPPVVIDFHAAYYTGMIDTVPHVPERCFVGGGMQLGGKLGEFDLNLPEDSWSPVSFTPSRHGGRVFRMRVPNWSRTAPGDYVYLPRNPGEIRLRVMEFAAEDKRPFYSGYFFIANGGWVARSEGVRELAFDLRTKYAYYAKVQFTARGMDSPEAFVAESASLLNDLLPEVLLCLPDWTELERRYGETGWDPPGATAPTDE
ncbi:MAG TPA: exosortase-associated EpsI family protein [Phycisphaerales bacterium]|nr:exosortase-associated EpsI family protein [Phycisphaerales bacterium]